MSSIRQSVGPAYLFACIVMGGSAQGIFSNLALQLAGIVILAWALLAGERFKPSPPSRRLLWIAAASILLVLVQLIPLPPIVWTHVPGRQVVADGFALLRQPLPWMPLSLAPDDTIATAMAMVPPLAMLALIVPLGAYRENGLIGALLLAAFISVALGVLQIQSSGTGPYLYPQANLGTASGLFANANHMGTLLLVSIPFLVALAVRRWREQAEAADRVLTASLAGGACVVLLLGMALNHSFALIVIGLPVLAAAALQVAQVGRLKTGRLSASIGIVLIAGMAILAATMSSGMSADNRTSVSLRSDIWSRTVHAIGDYGIAGTGVGTFSAIYPAYEDPASVERTYVNHAHNDYLELALEGGIPAVLLLASFLLWWAGRTIAQWRSPDAGDVGRAASIASVAILLHSLVDYPLRTAAIATIFAMAVGLMVDRGRRPVQVWLPDLRPTRHRSL